MGKQQLEIYIVILAALFCVVCVCQLRCSHHEVDNRSAATSCHHSGGNSNYDFAKNTVFGRFEAVQKTGHDLVLTAALEHRVFIVNALSIGYVSDLVKDKGLDVGLSGMFTANFNPSTLTSFYGGSSHGGWQIYLHFRPSKTQ